MTVENALRVHAKKYPKMLPCDAVKLIYQACFGAGHLISDKKSAKIYYEEEISLTPIDEKELFEEIGNGFYRYNLSSKALRERKDEIFSLFIASANETKGDAQLFETSLNALRRLTEEGIFGFTIHDLEEYLEKYISAGCPAVSHSEVYRNEYRPAYRVIGRKLGEGK